MSHPEMMIAEDYYRAIKKENAFLLEENVKLIKEIWQLKLQLAALTEKEAKRAN